MKRPSLGDTRVSIWLALGVVYGVWGSTYLALRILVEAVPPFLAAGSRFVVAGAILVGLAALRGRSLQGWLPAAGVGVLLFGVGAGTVAWAERTISSSEAALLVATVPLWVALLDGIASRRLTLGVVGRTVMGFGGVALLVGGAAGASVRLPHVMVVLSASAWAGGSLLSRSGRLPSSPLMSGGIEMLAGGFALLALSAATGEYHGFGWEAIGVGAIWSWCWLVIAGSVVAFTAYTWLLRHAPAPKVATYAYVNPVIAVVLGVTLGGESLAPRAVVGAAVVVASVVLTLRPDAPLEPISDEAGDGVLEAADLTALKPCMVGLPMGAEEAAASGTMRPL